MVVFVVRLYRREMLLGIVGVGNNNDARFVRLLVSWVGRALTLEVLLLQVLLLFASQEAFGLVLSCKPVGRAFVDTWSERVVFDEGTFTVACRVLNALTLTGLGLALFDVRVLALI